LAQAPLQIRERRFALLVPEMQCCSDAAATIS
jgi:hypothetical protein